MTDAADATADLPAAPPSSPYAEYPAAPEDAVEGEPTALPIPPLALPRTRMAFDFAASKITAGLVAAIARAQSAIRAVGKTSRNEQRKYDYANADDMIGEYRRAFAAEGVATVSSHYMQEPPNTDPITVDENGHATQWIDCTLKGQTLVMFTEIATREVGILVVNWEQDAIGKRGTPIDKSQRAAETYALGFVCRGIGMLSRSSTPADEDRDAAGDDQGHRAGGGRGTRSGSNRPAQRQQPAQARDDKPHKPTDEDKAAALRQPIVEHYRTLGGKDWKPWGDVCTAAGLKGAIRVNEGGHADLTKLHDYLAEAVLAREVDQRTPEGE